MIILHHYSLKGEENRTETRPQIYYHKSISTIGLDDLNLLNLYDFDFLIYV
ncbi:unnamed protein product [Brassica napus]|uniref:(rape) hypothetical protein n=1 Tax=Brassica napus TaxID=3708 RepID=A0A816MS23_BRANA|nr:unnamed protein product [Brassica napus]